MFALTTSSVALVAVLGMCLTDEVIRYENQEDYNGFLEMIAQQNEKDKSRENEYFFRGEPNDHYGADRHGQLFVKCKSGKIPNVQPLNSTRCMMRSADFLPACSFTHDYLNNESFYDCYDLDEDVDKACNDECDIKVSEHLSEVTRIRRTIGFCCCTTPDCNTQSKEKLDRAYKKFNREQHHHHHHHHHSEKTHSRGFFERFRQI